MLFLSDYLHRLCSSQDHHGVQGPQYAFRQRLLWQQGGAALVVVIQQHDIKSGNHPTTMLNRHNPSLSLFSLQRLELAGPLLGLLFEDLFKRFNSKLQHHVEKVMQKVNVELLHCCENGRMCHSLFVVNDLMRWSSPELTFPDLTIFLSFLCHHSPTRQRCSM